MDYTSNALRKLKASDPTNLEFEVGTFLIFNKESIRRKCQSMLTILTLVLETPLPFISFQMFCDTGLMKIIKNEIEMNFLLNGEELVQVMDQQWIEWVLGESLMNLTRE
jgi:hypothetical protein